MIKNMLSKLRNKNELSKDEIADLLKVNPELLEQFEKAYKNISDEPEKDNFFKVSAKQASQERKENKIDSQVNLDNTVEQIVEELLVQAGISNKELKFLEAPELNAIPEKFRPQLSGKLVQKHIEQDSYITLLANYKRWLEKGDIQSYHMFRQGLDILDLDPITYEIIGTNKNSMGYWFPKVKSAIDFTGYFKYPKTKIVKVPLPLLQLTRLDYSNHTPSTIKILNEFCMKAFDLDVNKEYFIKTGTYSSKFDFRNAVVKGEKEVRELGEYLLFIHFQALQMAAPGNNRSIYGVSTTNEWVVREYIKDKENNPTIYKGMPLHTEYRFFVDFDKQEILGVSPYWREDVMKRSFDSETDIDKKHDYVIYKMHEETLYKRYNDNIAELTNEMKNLIKNVDLEGQWSIDVMQNAEEFYVIDMALASESALSDVVPKDKMEKYEHNWIPNMRKLVE